MATGGTFLDDEGIVLIGFCPMWTAAGFQAIADRYDTLTKLDPDAGPSPSLVIAGDLSGVRNEAFWLRRMHPAMVHYLAGLAPYFPRENRVVARAAGLVIGAGGYLPAPGHRLEWDLSRPVPGLAMLSGLELPTA